jgi:hypothetical protein
MNRMRSLARQLLAVSLCALAAHVAVYGSLLPHGRVHGYFVWYEPLVASLSFVSVAGLPLLLALAFLAGRESRPTRALTSLLPSRPTTTSASAEAFKLAALALAFLTVQESLERSLATGELALASFAPGRTLVLGVAVLVAAAVIVLVERAVHTLADAIRRSAGSTTRRPDRARWHVRPAVPHTRRRPLAVNGGLRAPPVAL